MAGKGLAVDPNDPVAHYTIGVIDWREAYRNAIQTRNGLGMQDNGDMIKDKAACQKLAEQNGPIVDEGIKELQQAINLRPGYDDAMSYLSLIYRRKADLDCGDEAGHKADMAMFDQWRERPWRPVRRMKRRRTSKRLAASRWTASSNYREPSKAPGFGQGLFAFSNRYRYNCGVVHVVILARGYPARS